MIDNDDERQEDKHRKVQPQKCQNWIFKEYFWKVATFDAKKHGRIFPGISDQLVINTNVFKSTNYHFSPTFSQLLSVIDILSNLVMIFPDAQKVRQ